jgi:hypothetical protein
MLLGRICQNLSGLVETCQNLLEHVRVYQDLLGNVKIFWVGTISGHYSILSDPPLSRCILLSQRLKYLTLRDKLIHAELWKTKVYGFTTQAL